MSNTQLIPLSKSELAELSKRYEEVKSEFFDLAHKSIQAFFKKAESYIAEGGSDLSPKSSFYKEAEKELRDWIHCCFDRFARSCFTVEGNCIADGLEEILKTNKEDSPEQKTANSL